MGPPPGNAQLIADCKALNIVPPAPTPPPPDFDVLEDNWEAVQWFFRLRTAWNLGGMGGFLGLDYCRVESALRLARVAASSRPRLFEKLQIMEWAALPLLNRKA